MNGPVRDRKDASPGGDTQAGAGGAAAGQADDHPLACPFCGSEDTELMSLFGSSALTSQYYCRSCRTAFEQIKWGNRARPARPRP